MNEKDLGVTVIAVVEAAREQNPDTAAQQLRCDHCLSPQANIHGVLTARALAQPLDDLSVQHTSTLCYVADAIDETAGARRTLRGAPALEGPN